MKLQGLRGVNPSIYPRLTIANVGVSTQLNFTRFCHAPFPAPLFFYFTVAHHLRGIEPSFLHASRTEYHLPGKRERRSRNLEFFENQDWSGSRFRSIEKLFHKRNFIFLLLHMHRDRDRGQELNILRWKIISFLLEIEYKISIDRFNFKLSVPRIVTLFIFTWRNNNNNNNISSGRNEMGRVAKFDRTRNKLLGEPCTSMVFR